MLPNAPHPSPLPASGEREPSVRLERNDILGVEGEIENPSVVGSVLGDAEPRADYHACHRRPIEHIAGADIGDADAVLPGDLFQRREQFLEQAPAAPGGDHAGVFLQ